MNIQSKAQRNYIEALRICNLTEVLNIQEKALTELEINLSLPTDKEYIITDFINKIELAVDWINAHYNPDNRKPGETFPYDILPDEDEEIPESRTKVMLAARKAKDYAYSFIGLLQIRLADIYKANEIAFSHATFLPRGAKIRDEKVYNDFDKKNKELAIPKKAKKKLFSAPVIRCFCELVNISDLIVIGVDESAGAYCKRVCGHFKLEYTDRVRQHFNRSFVVKKSDKHLCSCINDILPVIPEEEKLKIQAYINNKLKLYA